MIYPAQVLTNGVAIAPLVVVDKLDNPDNLISSFNELIKKANLKIKQLEKNYQAQESANVLAFFKTFLTDPFFIEVVKKNLKKGYSVNRAISYSINQLIRKLASKDNPNLLKSHKAAFNDMKAFLLGLNNNTLSDYKEDIILYFKKLTLSDLSLNNPHIKGIIVEDITLESHLVILARALSIPVVINSQIKARNNDLVIISKKEGIVIVNPTSEELAKYEAIKARDDSKKNALLTYTETATFLKDNYKINLAVNISNMSELNQNYNEGIGLVRTEYLFKIDYDYDSQLNGYKLLFSKNINNLPTIRLFDLASDKSLKNYLLPLKYGRGVRIINVDKSLYLTQIKALLDAYLELNLNSEIKILIPFVTNADDIRSIKNIINELATNDLKYQSILNKIKLGSMIEIPIAIANIKELINEADFFSLGTSDLICNYYAINRAFIDKVNLDNTFFKILSDLNKFILANNKELVVCGDLASTKEGLLALISIGFNKFSVVPQELGYLRAMLSKITYKELENLNCIDTKINLISKIKSFIEELKNNE